MKARKPQPLTRKQQKLVADNMGLADRREPPPDDLCMVPELLAKLDARTAEVLRARFWGYETLETVGRRIGVTKERVRQIQNEGLATLRQKMEGKPR